MRHTRFHVRHMRAPVRRTPGALPSPFTLVALLLLIASVLLVGAGVIALLLAPFAILTGISLLVCTLSLFCLVGIAKGCIALALWLARWFSRRPMCSSLRPSMFLLRVLLARMLANWLANWLASHDPATHPPGASSASPYQTRVSALLKGA